MNALHRIGDAVAIRNRFEMLRRSLDHIDEEPGTEIVELQRSLLDSLPTNQNPSK